MKLVARGMCAVPSFCEGAPILGFLESQVTYSQLEDVHSIAGRQGAMHHKERKLLAESERYSLDMCLMSRESETASSIEHPRQRDTRCIHDLPYNLGAHQYGCKAQVELRSRELPLHKDNSPRFAKVRRSSGKFSSIGCY
jgi:hypothetical protein